MNIEYWISELDGRDPYRAIRHLRSVFPDLARPAIPVLLKLIQRGDRILGYEAIRLAIQIGPDHASDLCAVLQFLLSEEPCGWMLPDVVVAFERLASQTQETVQLLGAALSYPHFRVRVAAAHGLSSMGTLLAFVEQPLLCALDDPSKCVTEAVAETLLTNCHSLSPRLEAGLADHLPVCLSSEERRAADDLERALWKTRASQLNGLGDDGEDAVFFLRRLTDGERDLPDAALLQQLLASHGLPADATSVNEIDADVTENVLSELLHPIFSPDLVTEESVDVLTNRLLGFFDANVRVYSNATIQEGVIHEFQPVSACLIDVGLIWKDDTRVGMFWVADED